MHACMQVTHMRRFQQERSLEVSKTFVELLCITFGS